MHQQLLQTSQKFKVSTLPLLHHNAFNSIQFSIQSFIYLTTQCGRQWSEKQHVDRRNIHTQKIIMLCHHKLNRCICDADECEFERGWYGLIQSTRYGRLVLISCLDTLDKHNRLLVAYRYSTCTS